MYDLLFKCSIIANGTFSWFTNRILSSLITLFAFSLSDQINFSRGLFLIGAKDVCDLCSYCFYKRIPVCGWCVMWINFDEKTWNLDMRWTLFTDCFMGTWIDWVQIGLKCMVFTMIYWTSKFLWCFLNVRSSSCN